MCNALMFHVMYLLPASLVGNGFLRELILQAGVKTWQGHKSDPGPELRYCMPLGVTK